MMASRVPSQFRLDRRCPSSPAVQRVPSAISGKPPRDEASMELRGVFMKYPG
jgi:hypothetical protein